MKNNKLKNLHIKYISFRKKNASSPVRKTYSFLYVERAQGDVLNALNIREERAQHDVMNVFNNRKMECFLCHFPRFYVTIHPCVFQKSSGRKDAGQSGHDVGIDLVVKTFSGEFWAVQCKCYQKDSSVTLAMVSNFIAAGITQFFDDEERTHPCNFSRLIFVNTGRMTATSKGAFSGKPFDYTFINSYQYIL